MVKRLSTRTRVVLLFLILLTVAAVLRDADAPDEVAWAQRTLYANWTDIEKHYPIASVRERFLHVLKRMRSGQIGANLVDVPNRASADVLCATDADPQGRPRINFYVPRFRTLYAEVPSDAFQDMLINCMVHENIHLEEQPEFNEPGRQFTWEEFAASEADAWCKTTERILVPMRDAGRAIEFGTDRAALKIFDEVGADCRHLRWMVLGSLLSPKNPAGEYREK